MHRIIHQIIVIFNSLIAFIIFFNSFFKASPNGEYSNLTFLTTPGLFPNFSSAKHSNLPSYLDDNAEY